MYAGRLFSRGPADGKPKFTMFNTVRLYLLKNGDIIVRNFILEQEALILDEDGLPDEVDDTPDPLYRADHHGRHDC